ncbi:hypothetical protein TRV_00188 [Trichophyton verrucosum HKI 0517]|uniref:Uncharacterized protein n=1 Tax=Trichophyton verrucosum (strain HKI 0517) TaxID=663202 RepID=D4CZE6_TRIVH|nr:uncharacterized protein TRV_00188 [Trichophyton verrucosum HKI 0517]EFE45026.1 hypothetical protein TRV_00188 [Trichophyton verrucosum HKI 0517]
MSCFSITNFVSSLPLLFLFSSSSFPSQPTPAPTRYLPVYRSSVSPSLQHTISHTGQQEYPARMGPQTLGLFLIVLFVATRTSRVMSAPALTARDSPTAGGAATGETNGQIAARWMVYFSPLVGLIISVLSVTVVPKLVLWFKNLGKTGDEIIKSQEEQIETIRRDVSALKSVVDNIKSHVEPNQQNYNDLKTSVDEIKTSINSHLKAVEARLSSINTRLAILGRKCEALKAGQDTIRSTLDNLMQKVKDGEPFRGTTSDSLQKVIEKQDGFKKGLDAFNDSQKRTLETLDRLIEFIPALVGQPANPQVAGQGPD